MTFLRYGNVGLSIGFRWRMRQGNFRSNDCFSLFKASNEHGIIFAVSPLGLVINLQDFFVAARPLHLPARFE